jgi:hypothetical protein
MKSISRRGLIGVIAGMLGALLLGPGASAGGHPAQQMQNSKRCYSVDETFYKIHDLKVTKEIRPIEHCYFDKDHPYRYSVVDIPVSLAVGTVRTPEFAPPSHWYWILLQVEKPLPTEQMACMMAVADDSPDSWKDCPLSDRLLRADWTVWSEGQVVSSGSSTTKGDAEYTKDNIFKFLGSFPTLPGKRYVVEMKFTKDGTPLNVANPHLIVTKMGDE